MSFYISSIILKMKIYISFFSIKLFYFTSIYLKIWAAIGDFMVSEGWIFIPKLMTSCTKSCTSFRSSVPRPVVSYLYQIISIKVYIANSSALSYTSLHPLIFYSPSSVSSIFVFFFFFTYNLFNYYDTMLKYINTSN